MKSLGLLSVARLKSHLEQFLLLPFVHRTPCWFVEVGLAQELKRGDLDLGGQPPPQYKDCESLVSAFPLICFWFYFRPLLYVS